MRELYTTKTRTMNLWKGSAHWNLKGDYKTLSDIKNITGRNVVILAAGPRLDLPTHCGDAPHKYMYKSCNIRENELFEELMSGHAKKIKCDRCGKRYDKMKTVKQHAIEKIKEDNAISLVVDRAYQIFKNDITADYILSIDPTDKIPLMINEDVKIPLIQSMYNNYMVKEWFKDSERFIFCPEFPEKINSWFFMTAKRKGLERLYDVSHVTTTALSLCFHLKAADISIYGSDYWFFGQEHKHIDGYKYFQTERYYAHPVEDQEIDAPMPKIKPFTEKNLDFKDPTRKIMEVKCMQYPLPLKGGLKYRWTTGLMNIERNAYKNVLARFRMGVVR